MDGGKLGVTSWWSILDTTPMVLAATRFRFRSCILSSLWWSNSTYEMNGNRPRSLLSWQALEAHQKQQDCHCQYLHCTISSAHLQWQHSAVPSIPPLGDHHRSLYFTGTGFQHHFIALGQLIIHQDDQIDEQIVSGYKTELLPGPCRVNRLPMW